MPDTWIAPFVGTGQVCYDRSAKEFVKISNGTCTLDHSTPEGFRQSHTAGGCVYAPSEAIALRVVGITKPNARATHGDPIVAFTYRGVNPADLNPCLDDAGFPDVNAIRRSRFAGRV